MSHTTGAPPPEPELNPTLLDGQDEGRRRTRRVVTGIATALVSRGAAALAPLLLIPITLTYLGKDAYGLWMAVTSLTAMLVWADFGLGNGLMTKLTSSYAEGDVAAARRYVSTTYAILVGTATALLGILIVVSPRIPWASVFNVSDPQTQRYAHAVVLICLTAMLLNIPLSIVQRVQYATQRVAQGNLWQAAGSLTSVGLAATAVASQAGPELVIASAVSGPLVVNIVQSLVVYSRRHASISPRPRFVDGRLSLPLLSLGGQFFALSILTSISLNADNLIIARALGASDVADYAVPYKLFSALGLIVTLVNLPLWTANGEALARGDVRWVRMMTTRMSVFSGIAVLLPSIALVLLGQPFIQLLTGTDISASRMLLIALASWWFVLAITSPAFMVQNAAGLLRPQMVGWASFLVLSVPLKHLAAQNLGLAAIPAVGAALYLLCLWPAAYVPIGGLFRRMRETSGRLE